MSYPPTEETLRERSANDAMELCVERCEDEAGMAQRIAELEAELEGYRRRDFMDCEILLSECGSDRERLEAEGDALRARLEVANRLSVAVDEWDAGEVTAEDVVQANDDFVTLYPLPSAAAEGGEQ